MSCYCEQLHESKCRDSSDQQRLKVPRLCFHHWQLKQRIVVSQFGSKSKGSILEWKAHSFKGYLADRYLNYCFEYIKICPARQTRVLELLPGQRFEDPLEGRFQVHELDSLGDYEAVSHCWGRCVAGDKIYCDGAPLEITQSISNALRRFRRRDCPRRLWIDSICINQSDKHEKEPQVQHMGQIYSSAQATLVWVGEESASTGTAFTTLRKATDMLQTANKQYGMYPTFGQLQTCGLLSIDKREWAPLSQLVMGNDWFVRTWTLQEVGLAPKSILQCGSFLCDFNDLLNLSTAINYAGAFAYLEVWGLARVVAIGSIVSQNAHHDRSLWQLLYMTLSHEVSDPRDKVYALLGLALDGRDFTHLVDYDKSAQTLYLEVFQHYLDKGRFGLLNKAGRVGWRFASFLPSWAPDWFASYSPTNVIGDSCWHPQLCIEAGPPSMSPDGRVLRTAGFVVDYIRETRKNIDPTGDLQERPDLRRWKRLATRHEFYPTGERSIDAFASSMVLNAPIARTSSFASPGDLFHAANARVKDVRGDKASASPPTAQDMEAIVYLEMMNRCHNGLRFFRTFGEYIGLGSYYLLPGDIIVELEGGITPYLIRPRKDGYFKFLGEVYMHGKMHMPDLPEKQCIREFKLV